MTSGSMRYVGATDRRDYILDTLRRRGFLSVAALSRDLRVSDMTIRRDLRRLEESGQAQVVHGGASLPHGSFHTSAFAVRAGTNSVAKGLIAELALTLIRPHHTIAVDAGTTAYQLADALPRSFHGLVVTNSVPVIQLLLSVPDRPLIGLGGDLVRASQAFAGPMTAEDARRLRVDTFFLGAAAVDENGPYVAADIERATKLALMDIADRVVLLADHDKFMHRAPVLLAPLSRIDVVVSDAIPADLVGALDSAEVRTLTPRHRVSGTGRD